MNAEEDPELSKSSTGSSVLSLTTTSSSPGMEAESEVRRRDAASKLNQEDSGAESNGDDDRVPLMDKSERWTDHLLDRKSETNLSGKQNGLVNGEDEEGFDFQERSKINDIRRCLANPESTLGEFRHLSCSAAGLVNDDIRRVLWPKLLRIPTNEPDQAEDLETIHDRVEKEVYQQILKDVTRSGSHVSQNATQLEIDRFYEQLTQMICWVLHKHSNLNYYQGYNDVAATVLLVMGLQSGLRVLESISLGFLERFMEKTMEKVNQELFYIYALLERVHPKLLEHLENVELFPHFALAEYTTWYAHKYAENRKLLHRLYDFFLGSPPLMPLYLSTVIVAYRDVEIFNTTPDMGHTHKALCTLPPDLPIETLLQRATDLYQKYPPESIMTDVREYDQKRRQKEQGWKATAEAGRKERERELQRRKNLQVAQRTSKTILRNIPKNIRTYGTGITVVTILALGLYAFLKTSAGLN